MLDRQTLLSLSQYRNQERPVISLYLEVDRDSPADKHAIHLKNLVAEAEGQRDEYPGDVWQSVQQDLDKMRDWVRDNDVRSGQGVALFACGDELWQAFIIPYPLANEVTLGDRARLRPLYRQLQRYDRYLTILSDARDARVFSITPDETREIAQVEGETPGRHEQGGWSQARFQRHQDKKVEEHLANAADLAFRLFQSRGFDGVILMGTDDRTNRLLDHLHPYLHQRVLDRLPMDMDANKQEVGEETLKIGRERRRERQAELVDEWEGDIKADTGLGAAGLEETLRAAQQGQLMTLLMRDDLSAEGGKCRQCGTLTTSPNGACDFCGGEIRHFPDVTEALTVAAINQGAELIFLAPESGARRLDEYGGVGAILRYVANTADELP